MYFLYSNILYNITGLKNKSFGRTQEIRRNTSIKTQTLPSGTLSRTADTQITAVRKAATNLVSTGTKSSVKKQYNNKSPCQAIAFIQNSPLLGIQILFITFVIYSCDIQHYHYICRNCIIQVGMQENEGAWSPLFIPSHFIETQRRYTHDSH